MKPAAPKWLPEWLNAYLIVIDLESKGTEVQLKQP